MGKSRGCVVRGAASERGRWAAGLRPGWIGAEFYADAGIVHEVDVKTADGHECEVSATPDGTLRYQECEMELAKVPAHISAAVKSAYPEGKLLEVETKKGPGLDVLTAEVESGGVEYYLTMSTDGTIEAVHKRVEALVEIPVAIP